ncbi:putative secondary metabolism biosynthetic enzyme [Blastosporella zonata]|nr:putative secondary metabolism biosynthetic enzyme [Blastosporella zonata]
MWSQTFPPAAQFSVDQIPDLSGKVMVVTGGNTGIGKEIVRALLSHNAKVYMASRNAEKAKDAIEELKKDTGKEASFLELDLASLNSVRKAAEEFLSKEQELHTLFNNGGTMFLMETPHSMDVTEDGYDIQWGTNVVGPFHFTQLLMPALLAAARHSDDKSRVVFTSSIVLSKGINFDSLRDTPARKKVGADQRYGQSKLANIVLAREVARRYGDKGVIAVSLDPGGTKTDLQQHLPSWARPILNLMLHPPAQGALTSLYAGTTSEPMDINGKKSDGVKGPSSSGVPFSRVLCSLVMSAVGCRSRFLHSHNA